MQYIYKVRILTTCLGIANCLIVSTLARPSLIERNVTKFWMLGDCDSALRGADREMSVVIARKCGSRQES